MKVSNKIFSKIILLVITAILIIFSIFYIGGTNYYKETMAIILEMSKRENIYLHYLEQPRLLPVGTNVPEEKLPLEFEDYYTIWDEYNVSIYNTSKQEYNKCLVISIITTILSIGFIIIDIVYIIKSHKLIKQIKKYRNFILATNKNTIEEISKEFDQNAEIVESNIQKAIDKHILKNVYLSKQTKEILPIKNIEKNIKANGNIQNVNVENNVIFTDKKEN